MAIVNTGQGRSQDMAETAAQSVATNEWQGPRMDRRLALKCAASAATLGGITMATVAGNLTGMEEGARREACAQKVRPPIEHATFPVVPLKMATGTYMPVAEVLVHGGAVATALGGTMGQRRMMLRAAAGAATAYIAASVARLAGRHSGQQQEAEMLAHVPQEMRPPETTEACHEPVLNNPPTIESTLNGMVSALERKRIEQLAKQSLRQAR